MFHNFFLIIIGMQLKEIQSLRLLSHPNIIKLYEIIRQDDKLSLVLELCDQNLSEYIQQYSQQQQQIPEDEIKSIIFQIAKGVSYMHSHGFLHRDLKPENIMFKGKKLIKICDFGSVKEIVSKPPFTEYLTTRYYRAPELILPGMSAYNQSSDIFALGCIMSELYNLSTLFNGNSSLDQMYKLCEIMGTPSQFT
eukprot:TRINITY_DN2929_c0_g1_i2.p2 TRINITY_DN2929_c0_g1~~TRINITY_DN2929_c0_g1_i2.p2  ORF type:complete len:194 (+),score=19.85 TRINITY_DN2929_c0_g1_i2:154-735(+)